MNPLPGIVALIPILVINVYVYWRDQKQPEPLRLLAISFVLGAATFLPILYVEKIWIAFWPNWHENLISIFIFSQLAIAFTEEGFKFLVLRLYCYRLEVFDEPFDGIVYALMVSMGFAAVENVLYSNSYGLEVAILRAFTAVPAHGSFAVLMGYWTGKAKYGRGFNLFLGLGVATFAHGLYDFFLLQQSIPGLVAGGFVFLALCLIVSIVAIEKRARQQPQT
jgi:RsiW-degrading membrane proteinase PrsW (M82 family)